MSKTISGCFFCILMQLTPPSHAQVPVGPNTPTPNVAMSDQFGRAQDVTNLRGDVVVLVFADRQGAEASRALGERLHVEFHPSAKGLSPVQASKAAVRPVANWTHKTPAPDAKMVALACIGDVPSMIHSYVRKRFREVASDVPIWLDMNDQLRKQFTVKPGVANVVVLDVKGRQRFSTAGDFDTAQFQKLTDVIENLRMEAAPKQ